MAGRDPDYAIRDLYNSISEVDGHIKKYPSWTFYVQLMAPEQAEQQIKSKFNPFDITKAFLHPNPTAFPYVKQHFPAGVATQRVSTDTSGKIRSQSKCQQPFRRNRTTCFQPKQFDSWNWGVSRSTSAGKIVCLPRRPSIPIRSEFPTNSRQQAPQSYGRFKGETLIFHTKNMVFF